MKLTSSMLWHLFLLSILSSPISCLPTDPSSLMSRADLSRATSSLISRADLSLATIISLEWEEKQWATGSVHDNPFYTAPTNSTTAPASSLVKLEPATNTSLYTLPPLTTLSRFMYLSETLNGTIIPVSAYILWPYAPRESEDGCEMVAWAHGTSGNGPETAPSHMKNLWQHFLGPFQLALQGYVVIGTDYAGLGVSKTADGRAIIHESFGGASDVLYAVQAARAAFPELGKKFVVMGSTEGATVAWQFGQRQAVTPTDGYLGGIAISPITNLLDEPALAQTAFGVTMLPAIEAMNVDFKVADVLTTKGLAAYENFVAVGGNYVTTTTLLGNFTGLFQANWTLNADVKKYIQHVSVGGRDIKEPLLVIHGELDPQLPVNVVAKVVNITVQEFLQVQIEFVSLAGVGHTPSNTASQPIWMDWIAARFTGEQVYSGVRTVKPKSARPAMEYQPQLNWYMSLANASYQAP